MHIVPSPRWLARIVPALLLAGCSPDEIRTEVIPKESLLPLTYDLPPGWGELGRRAEQKGIIRVEILAAFSLAGGAKDDEMTITALKGGGTKKGDVKRWADQVERKEKELPKAEEITVGGIKGDYYHIEGPQKSILVAVVPKGDQTWYFKLLAARDVAKKNEKAFKKTFLESVKYKGADDE